MSASIKITVRMNKEKSPKNYFFLMSDKVAAIKNIVNSLKVGYNENVYPSKRTSMRILNKLFPAFDRTCQNLAILSGFLIVLSWIWLI
jgi:hypothetical protein